MAGSGAVVWIAVIVLACVLILAPVIVAAARQTEKIGLVILLTLLTPVGGWFAAWVPTFMLPRRGGPGSPAWADRVAYTQAVGRLRRR